MDAKKKSEIRGNSWKVGPAADFLELSEEESEYIEIKIALGQ